MAQSNQNADWQTHLVALLPVCSCRFGNCPTLAAVGAKALQIDADDPPQVVLEPRYLQRSMRTLSRCEFGRSAELARAATQWTLTSTPTRCKRPYLASSGFHPNQHNQKWRASKFSSRLSKRHASIQAAFDRRTDCRDVGLHQEQMASWSAEAPGPHKQGGCSTIAAFQSAPLPTWDASKRSGWRSAGKFSRTELRVV